MKLFYSYCNQRGRSMIEMLGVLAIVGILSVGGIAGFNKAMAKYQAIKWVSEVLLSFQEFMHYRDDWVKIGGADRTDYVNSYMQTAVPSSWILRDNRFYSNGGESVTFGMYHKKPFMNIIIPDEKTSHAEYCLNLFNNIIIPYTESIHYVHKFFHSPSTGISSSALNYYGANYCTSAVACIRDLSITGLIEVCTPTEDEKENKSGLNLSIYIK